MSSGLGDVAFPVQTLFFTTLLSSTGLAFGWHDLPRLWARRQDHRRSGGSFESLRRDLDEPWSCRFDPHKRGVNPVHPTQIRLGIARPRLQSCLAPPPAEKHAHMSLPGKRVP